MSFRSSCFLALSLMIIPSAGGVESATSIDLRRAAPASAHLVIYGVHNEEREYQVEYLREIWRTFEEEQIGQRLLKIIAGRVPEGELEKAQAVWDQLSAAIEPASFESILQADQIVYAQVMEMPVNNHLLIAQTTPDDAAGLEQAASQLFDLLGQWSEGEVRTIRHDEGELHAIVLDLPQGVPLRPALCRIGNVVVISTHESLARQAAAMLDGNGTESKFDDPRLIEALSQLPEPEDALFFFDGQLMFEKMRGLSDFMRRQTPNADENVDRFVSIYERVLDELSILDYEITVEYTDGLQNRSAVLGKLVPDAREKMLYRAVAQGEPFENWETWVPADATSYSLHTGVNLRVVYQWLIGILREEIPESHEALAKWKALQEELGVDIDHDLLGSFSGESIAVTLPVETSNGGDATGSVSAHRCSNPERIGELIQTAVHRLAEAPALESQKLRLKDSEELEGFQELEAAFLPLFGVRPVIGFHDGWMICSGSPEAVAKVLATRRGEAPSITKSANYQNFGVSSDGPVSSVSYTDLNASIEQAAQTIEQIAAIAPVVIGMVSAGAEDQDLTPVAEAVSLLPSVAKVVRKFDYLEDKLSVTREGPWQDSYRRDAVVRIRAPE